MIANNNCSSDTNEIPKVAAISNVKEKLEKPPNGVGTWLSARYCLAYLAFLGFINLYTLRVNLSVAILSMVNSSYLEPTNHNNNTECAESSAQTNHTGGEFNWNGEDRGLLLGAFFYGYIATQLPGGYLATRFGGKILMGGGILLTAVLTLLTPIAARADFSLLIVVRILEGFCEGVTYPAMQAMLGAWAPPIDRSRLVSLVFSGPFFGTVLAQSISGLLCDSDIMGGWPSAFYIFGIVAIVWCCLWFLLTSDTPFDYKWISPAELSYIEANIKPAMQSFWVPWKQIALSKPAWALFIACFAGNWGFYTLLTSLPLFLKEVLNYDLTQAGFISALPYLVMGISTNLCGFVADKVREKRVLSTTNTRKLFNVLANVGPAIFLITIRFVGCNKSLAVSCICFALMFAGCSSAADTANHIDIAPRYAGVLTGISNSFGTIPGFVTPLVVGVLTGNDPSRQNWMYVFYIAAAIYVLGAIAYLLLASGVEQDWNRIENSVNNCADERCVLVEDNQSINENT